MSTFAVTVETIRDIQPIAGADRLELGYLTGMDFQFVIQKGVYSVGEQVLYFPVDSILPEDVIKQMGLEGKLHGSEKNRVKTIKLRGVISQGLIGKTNEFIFNAKEGVDYAEVLGVTKWEPIEAFYNPAGSGKSGSRPEFLKPLPDLVGKYDIEGAQRHTDIVNLLNGMVVHVSEKLEGSHFAISYDGENTRFYQRNFEIDVTKIENHLWEQVAKSTGFTDYVQQLHYYLTYRLPMTDIENNNFLVTIRGELVGPSVQGNIYGLTKHQIYAFEIEVNGKPVSAYDFGDCCNNIGIPCVPTITFGKLSDILNGKSITEYSDGKSLINPKVMREGVVIKPYYTRKFITHFGDLIIKQRSPLYLAGSDL